MEAWRFGFAPMAGGIFDPTDEELVAHYLLPRAAGFHNAHAHVVIDADPWSCPPWELMRRHGHADSAHAFFFFFSSGPGRTGGSAWAWHASSADVERSLVMARGATGTCLLKYKKRQFAYRQNDDGGQSSAAGASWVMQEFEITDPLLPGAVLSRVQVTATANKKRQQQQPDVGPRKRRRTG
ncbi:hypothetical protein BS78_05G085400 [Paspalum vaginatum]|nr:hypothetical protein BS78_05G085400 [Paspalum vaginatum]